MRRRGGFTLIELLISVVLMIILLGAVTVIFKQTTDTVNISEARMTVYTNARYALDMMANDLMSCVSFNSGQQLFSMDNGKTGVPGNKPVYNVTGGHVGNAADRMSYICTTTVGDTLQTCMVTYELIPGNKALDATGALVDGDESHKQTIITNRGLYTLIRRVRVPKPGLVPPGEQPKYDQPALDRAGNVIRDTELCHYVLSFNLEYFANNQNFSQLEPSPFPSPEYSDGEARDPLGNGKGKNDVNPPPTPGPGGGGGGPVQTTALRIPYIRATLVIVEDTHERQERAIQKAMWIPVG